MYIVVIELICVISYFLGGSNIVMKAYSLFYSIFEMELLLNIQFPHGSV